MSDVALTFKLARETHSGLEGNGMERVRARFTIDVDGKPCKFVGDELAEAEPNEKGDCFAPRSIGVTANVDAIRKAVARSISRHLIRVAKAAKAKVVQVAGKECRMPRVPGNITDEAGIKLRTFVYATVLAAMPAEVKVPKTKEV